MIRSIEDFSWEHLGLTVPLMVVLAGSSTNAQEGGDSPQADDDIEEIVVIGSRSQEPRTAAESTVPIDVLNSEELSSFGNIADLTDNLKSLVPSYNASMASGDGDTYVRPTSLRGLAPDQSLLMINGKRRHRAALIAEFVPGAGKGAQGPNISMIPGIAIQSVEVLRDGAAAQYGSDAIAGVINLRLKENREGGTVRAQYGQHYEGELTYKLEGNVGLPLAADGFLSLSMEVISNEALSRGIQRPQGESLIEAGVPNVGADTPFEDAPFVQTWGRPQSDGTRIFWNAGVPFGESSNLYSHGNWAKVDGRYRFFFRDGDGDGGAPHITIATLRELGFTGLPQGFTPFFDGANDDISYVFGVNGFTAQDIYYDVSFGYGSNDLDFTLNNTINQSIGLGADGNPLQMDFDVGKLGQKETILNLDLLKQLNEQTYFAFGAQYHEETFEITAGEPNSYQGAGSSGFKGFEPQNAGEFSRDSYGLYGELEREFTDEFLGQFALRYEDFADFGSTLDYKVAARVFINQDWALRGSVSTGFHAPTPGQANIQKITTTFDNDTGAQIESGTVPPDHPLAIAAGGAPLTEETSVNFSVGFTGTLGDNITVTFDVYSISIEDRIYKTQRINVVDPVTNIGSGVEFFTNALDLESSGFDFVATTSVGGQRPTDLSLALNWNEVDVTGQNRVNNIEPVTAAIVEDIEKSYPSFKLIVTSNTILTDQLSLMTRTNYYGEHYDERGRIDGVDGNAPTKLLEPVVFIDVELSYELDDSFEVVLGFNNVFDTYIDEIDDPYANRQNVGLPYARRTAANFEGGSWYLTGTYRW